MTRKRIFDYLIRSGYLKSESLSFSSLKHHLCMPVKDFINLINSKFPKLEINESDIDNWDVSTLVRKMITINAKIPLDPVDYNDNIDIVIRQLDDEGDEPYLAKISVPKSYVDWSISYEEYDIVLYHEIVKDIYDSFPWLSLYSDIKYVIAK